MQKLSDEPDQIYATDKSSWTRKLSARLIFSGVVGSSCLVILLAIGILQAMTIIFLVPIQLDEFIQIDSFGGICKN
jgi:hypothetical protein